MAQPISYPVGIVGPQFCAPYPVDVAIIRKVFTITDGNFLVTDINGNLLFKVRGAFMSLHSRRVLLDPTGNPTVTLKKKMASTDPRNMVFTAKRSSMLQLKTKLDIFMANNTREEVCDYMVHGSWFERSCVSYAGNSSTIVAQMHKKHTVESIFLGKDQFMVTIYPNMDYAFIVAIIVILDEINSSSSSGGGFDLT